MVDRVRVAAIQMTCRLADRAANLDEAQRLLSRVSGRADIACLPELFDVGYDLETLRRPAIAELAEPVPAQAHDLAGPTVSALCGLAARFELAIVGGLLERDPKEADRIYDTVILIDRKGQVRGRYRKSHLYPAEEGIFQPGAELPVFELEGIRVGVAVCFEAAFPPLCSTLALAGAQVIFNPSAVPVGYGYLQDLRARARAQDNQLFFVAVNHVGTEGTVAYCGRSQVADPRGGVVAIAPEDRPAAVPAELDLALIADQRRQEPVLRGFRLELYRFRFE